MPMAEWFNPAWIIALLSAGGIIWTAARWTGKVDTTLQNIGATLNEIKASIEKIFERLPERRLAKASSPLSLNDLGAKIAKEMGSYKWAAELAPSLLSEVQGMEPFQIDEFAANYAESKLAAYWEGVVAATAYKTGLSRKNIRSALHIPLRDELLRLTGQD